MRRVGIRVGRSTFPLAIRRGTRDDLPFLRRMLYEAVYWRSIQRNVNPPFDEGLAASGVCNALDDWGSRVGDTALIFDSDSTPAGAAWYRFYNETNAIRGYLDEETPVIVLAVVSEYRRQGIGTMLITALLERASRRGTRRVSLMVSSDNHAHALYEKCGFRVCANTGDSYLMTREV